MWVAGLGNEVLALEGLPSDPKLAVKLGSRRSGVSRESLEGGCLALVLGAMWFAG